MKQRGVSCTKRFSSEFRPLQLTFEICDLHCLHSVLWSGDKNDTQKNLIGCNLHTRCIQKSSSSQWFDLICSQNVCKKNSQLFDLLIRCKQSCLAVGGFDLLTRCTRKLSSTRWFDLLTTSVQKLSASQWFELLTDVFSADQMYTKGFFQSVSITFDATKIYASHQ